MAKKSRLTKAKLANLRKRMVNHGVKDGKAIVELSARELQLLLDAADPPAVKYKVEETPIPTGDHPKHLYSVTVVVEADATGDLNQVVEHVMSACLRHPTHPLPVVDGWGVKAQNLTLSNAEDRGKSHFGMIQIGFSNKPIPKKSKTVPVIRRAD